MSVTDQMLPVIGAVAAWAALGAYVSFTDIRRGVIPRRAVWIAGSAITLLLTVAAVMQDDPRRMIWVGVGAGTVGLFFEVIYRRWPDQVGYGDVRLIIVNAILAGWWGVHWSWIALCAGAIAEWPVALVALARSGRNARVRWAPGLVVGTSGVIAFCLWSFGAAG